MSIAMMAKNFLFEVILGVFVWTHVPSVCFADSTEEWLSRASGAATQLVQGNMRGAAYQTIPTANIGLTDQTYVNAGIYGASLQQRLIPIGSYGSRYFNLNSAYNVNTDYGLNRPPHLDQNVQVSAQNPYVNNTATFTPPFRLSKRE